MGEKKGGKTVRNSTDSDARSAGEPSPNTNNIPYAVIEKQSFLVFVQDIAATSASWLFITRILLTYTP